MQGEKGEEEGRGGKEKGEKGDDDEVCLGQGSRRPSDIHKLVNKAAFLKKKSALTRQRGSTSWVGIISSPSSTQTSP
eukprot:3716157-Pyramimonas_sp.AAC.1